MECRFCQLRREQKKMVYQDPWISLFFDMDPISKGHALIITNEHYQDIDEIPDRVLEQVWKCAKVYVGLLKRHFKPAGYSMMQNGGAFNDIGHFHLHVFPRHSPAEFAWTYADETDPTATDFSNLRDLLQILLHTAMAAESKT